MDNSEGLKNLQLAAIMIRGNFLHRVIELETFIDAYIAQHFASDDTKLEEIFCLMLSPRISLENKKQVFVYLVDKYNPEFKREHKKYSSILTKIIEWRNVFAHYPIDITDEAVKTFEEKKLITFIKHKNSDDNLEKVMTLVNHLILTNEQVINFTKVIYDMRDAISKIVNLQQPPPLSTSQS